MRQRLLWAVLYELEFSWGWDLDALAYLSRREARAAADSLKAAPYYRNVRVVRFQATPGQSARAYEKGRA